MQITRQAEYAIRTLLELARAGPGETVETRRISERLEIPPVFLKKTIQLLARAGLVGTRRGAGGGVKLLIDPGKITMADVITATGGKPAFNPCLAEGASCPHAPSCRVRPIILRAQEAFIGELGRETLAEIAPRETKR